ncbi:phage tail sheath subtilisin-like domain-containing protein [Castellaniella sp. S9]|uniref:phage tail sheath subtilisin-like domain-containing protein n=1 Tax=Castellaniella sp. S9 TaxID=2993652 RepID=UPI0022B3FF39|nr:phage tail sheath subtilisin-like domain-containing protein [Castellaniella sp. S9]
MPEQFLHGVEVIELDYGARPISTVRSSVIGLIGTAPNARAQATAALALSGTASDTTIEYEAVAPGALGNNISIRYRSTGEESEPLKIAVANKAITVTLATDAQGDIITTASQLVTAMGQSTAASALVSAALPSGAAGAGVLNATLVRFLEDGADEAFPLDTPVLVAGSRLEAAGLGDQGTLPGAIDAIFDQAGAMVVVIRVEDDQDAGQVKSNIIGGVSIVGKYEGMQAFLAAESIVKVQPKILIAPGFTNDRAVVSEMLGIADRLRAVIIADGPNETDQAAISYRENFGSARVYIVDPWVKVWDTESNSDALQPASARVAGMIARSDNDRGFWWSPSNTEMYGITGTARAIDFVLGDPNSRANYLNENEVATIIEKDGARLWGNRTCSSDPKWAFLSVRRTADMINESLLRAHMWAVDRNITKTYVEDVLEGVNAYLRHLVAVGAILGGRAWADPALNTPDQITQGIVYFDFDFTPPYPAEHIVFRSRLVNDYIEEVFGAAA